VFPVAEKITIKIFIISSLLDLEFLK